MSLDLVIHTANVVALLGGLWGLLKVVVPVGLSVRDSLRDTAKNLSLLAEKTDDHEDRLRDLEYKGAERRKREHRQSD